MAPHHELLREHQKFISRAPRGDWTAEQNRSKQQLTILSAIEKTLIDDYTLEFGGSKPGVPLSGEFLQKEDERLKKQYISDAIKGGWQYVDPELTISSILETNKSKADAEEIFQRLRNRIRGQGKRDQYDKSWKHLKKKMGMD